RNAIRPALSVGSKVAVRAEARARDMASPARLEPPSARPSTAANTHQAPAKISVALSALWLAATTETAPSAVAAAPINSTVSRSRSTNSIRPLLSGTRRLRRRVRQRTEDLAEPLRPADRAVRALGQ